MSMFLALSSKFLIIFTRKRKVVEINGDFKKIVEKQLALCAHQISEITSTYTKEFGWGKTNVTYQKI